ncbi:aldose epimerase family protein [Pseudovibrio sp. SPO723]|uniref:aldose epimerase family protein n=1 Tax=Nesiotobacter zosterae TaxID=392721 RepID=UPI0029C34F71|nr:aldose epimerase family protein [Pseudovibrio sp. SPO723]MDX5594417.1 aldose epimerase family protein [Pseudovibrio sp. SPO723]
MEKTIVKFGEVDGKVVDLITLSNKNGMKVSVTNYGCIVTSIEVPGRDGKAADVVLGYESLEKYLAGHPFFGAIAGRFANRIQDGKFSLDDYTYQLETNEPPTVQHLHGGSKGFDKYVWGYDLEETEGAILVHFHRISVDGESGYPGTLDVTHTIGLDEENQLHYNFRAHTDKPTVINLVNHSYYNLAGHDSGSVAGHELTLGADFYTPVAENMIPTGEILKLADTGLDFRTAAKIGDNMEKVEGGAFDFNFILNGAKKEGEYTFAADLYDPESGRFMTVLTTQPAIQFYNGFKLSNKPWFGRSGYKYEAFGGLCLETQGFPDSPNKAHFPSPRLNPGEIYEHKTIHRFGTR